MATISVNPYVNPRIITVNAPTTTITVQELSDLIKDWEDEPASLAFPILVRTSGKESLGAGAFVGITMELQNALVAFEARSGPTEELMTITSGNLVAVDENGSSISPISPTAYTQVVIQQSTSPSIITPPEDLNMLYLIESLRDGSSKSVGSIFYWDPESGDDDNDGLQPNTAKATFAGAQTIATAGAGDIIFALATNSSGITTVTETLNINKAGLKLRGPGYAFQLVPAASGQTTVNIAADGVEFEGFYVETAAGGTDNGITVTTGSDKVTIKDTWVKDATGNGIDITGTARVSVVNSAIEDATGVGINIGNSTILSKLVRNIISGSGGDGIDISGASSSDNIFENNLIYGNTGYGIDIGAGVTRTGVRLNHTFSGNTAGETRDNGTSTFIETASGGASASAIADAVWDELITDHTTANTTGRTLRDAKTRATLASLT